MSRKNDRRNVKILLNPGVHRSYHIILATFCIKLFQNKKLKIIKRQELSLSLQESPESQLLNLFLYSIVKGRRCHQTVDKITNIKNQRLNTREEKKKEF